MAYFAGGILKETSSACCHCYFNISDLPLMFGSGSMLDPIAHYPFILPSVILFQILITWYFIYRYASR